MLFLINFAIINIYNIYFEGVKKLLKRILLILLIIIIFPTCAYAKDYENHCANAYIEKSLSQKIAYGNPDGNFYPDNNITRAEFAKMISVCLGLTSKEAASVFDSDVQEPRTEQEGRTTAIQFSRPDYDEEYSFPS